MVIYNAKKPYSIKKISNFLSVKKPSNLLKISEAKFMNFELRLLKIIKPMPAPNEFAKISDDDGNLEGKNICKPSIAVDKHKPKNKTKAHLNN